MASKVNVDKIARGSGSPEFTIPTADGAANTFLKTDGSGVLSFSAVTTTALTGSTNTWIPTITGANALTGTANFTYDGNTLDVKNSGTASSVKLYCESSNAHYQEIKAAPHSGSSNWTLTLPPTVPSVSGQALTATTAGVASWATVGGDNTPAFMVGTADDTNITGITSDTLTKVAFGTEIYDTDSAYDTTNYKFTVPAGEGGKYMIYFMLEQRNSVNTQNSLLENVTLVYLNGATPAVQNASGMHVYSRNSTRRIQSIQGTTVLELDAADYIELYVKITVSGGGTGEIDSRSWWGGHKLLL